jgi:chemotaxis response regulator CheB
MQGTIKVALAEPGAARAYSLAEALSADHTIVFQRFSLSPDEIVRSVQTFRPQVIVFYAPIFGDKEHNCVTKILRSLSVRILLVSEPTEQARLLRDPKLEQLSLAGHAAPPTSQIVSRVKRLAATDTEAPQMNNDNKFRLSQFAPKPFITGAQLSPNVLTTKLIAIGASTGGTEALAKLFHLLPPHMPGIVVVQHMPPVFTQLYAERLNKELPYTVTEAKDNVQILPNTIHIAPGDRHLLVKKKGAALYTVLGNTTKVNGHCPSVDVLFNSVADEYAWQAMGVILTGMGADGAAGMLRMKSKGSYTIGQDEASCVVYGMPRKAYEYGGVAQQAALTSIPQYMLSYLRNEVRS